MLEDKNLKPEGEDNISDNDEEIEDEFEEDLEDDFEEVEDDSEEGLEEKEDIIEDLKQALDSLESDSGVSSLNESENESIYFESL